VRRWWLVSLGFAIAAVALLALLRGGPARLPVAIGPAPLDHIDADTRERLDHVLREADRAAGDRR
jgi:hypothetical protein